ncbi:unnamed protein product [Orchesella dallaii]
METSKFNKLDLVLVLTSNAKEACHKALNLDVKSVLITEENQGKLMAGFKVNQVNEEMIYFATDEIKWDNLSVSFQEEILKNCKFVREMGSLCNILNDLALVDLIKNPSQTNMKQTLPSKISFYVPRRLKSRFLISKKVFSQGLDVYLFTGLERYELTEYAGERCTDGSKSQLAQSRLSSRFILLQMKSDFEKISKKTDQPVHWIHHENGNFSLKKSNGDMSDIQGFVKEQQQEFTEDDFLTHLTSDWFSAQRKTPVCIADSPGSGKSVLLANIGSKLIENGQDVIFVVFEEFIRKVRATSLVYDKLLDAVVRALGSVAFVTESEVGCILLKNLLQCENQSFELLFDGFDEVSRDDRDLAYECLRLMAVSFPAARLWVTTRLHLLKNLENQFQVLGYHITPFDEQDELSFFVSYWSQKRRDLDSEKLMEVAKTYLLTFKESMVTSSSEDIAGVPLLCRLIAEHYEESALEYADSTNLISSLVSPTTDVNSDITNVYEAHSTEKISSFCRKYKSEHVIQDLMKMHAFLSLKLMFPEWAERFKKSLFPNSALLVELEDAVLRVGIIESTSSPNPSIRNPRFVHRTFADFFISWFAVQSLENSSCDEDDLYEFIFLEVLGKVETRVKTYKKCGIEISCLRFTNKVASYFINNMISRVEYHGIASSSATGLGTFLRKKQYKCAIRDLARCCVAEDFQNLFEFLHHLNAFEHDSEILFNSNLLFLLIDKCSLPFIKSVLDNNESVGYCIQHDGVSSMSALNIAVRRGVYSIVEYLIHSQKLGVKVQTLESAHILHDCASFSATDSEMIINSKIQVVKLLINLNPMVLEEVYNGKHPIHCKWVHVKLLIELIRNGANILSLDSVGNSVLHNAVKYLGTVEYYKLIENISGCNMAKLVKIKGEFGLTPLHQLISIRDDVTVNILKTFANNGADFNCQDEDGETLLFTAIQQGRDKWLLEKLINYGTDYNLTCRNDESLLHIAAKYGNYDAVNLLVENGLDINSKDAECHTPLHSALFGKQENRFEMFDYLVDLGAAETLVEFDKTLMLLKAVNQKDMHSVQWLIKKNADVNSKNARGETVLHRVLSNYDYSDQNQYELLLLLLKKGADVYATNKEGETPLVSALKRGNVSLSILSIMESYGAINSNEVATLALKRVVTESKGLSPVEYVKIAEACFRKGVNLSHSFEKGDNLFHLAASSGCIRGVKYLLSKAMGTEFNVRNSDGDTPLHSAVEKHDEKELVKLLVKRGADLTIVNRLKYTILHSAIKLKRWNTSKYFIKSGHFINLCRNEEFILFAAKNANLVIFEMVCEQYYSQGRKLLDIRKDTTATEDIAKKSCLHVAVRGGNLEVVNYLLDSNTHGFADCLEELRMRDLVHVLARNSTHDSLSFKVEILTLLVKRQPSLLSETDSSGRIPMLLPNVHLNLLKCLINLGSNVKACNENGENVLHVAAAYLPLKDYTSLMKFLIRRGECGSLLCSRDRNSSTVLHKVAKKMLEGAAHEDVKNMLDLFVTQKADFSAVDDAGDSVLAYAIKANCETKNLKRLVKNGADDLRSKNRKQVSLLHWAAKHGNFDALEFLLYENNCDVNEKDDEGNTPLHYALDSDVRWKKRIEVIKVLVECDADLKSENKKGETVPYLAPRYMTPYMYDKFVKMVLKHDRSAFDYKCCHQRTPLHNAVKLLEVKPGTMEILAEHNNLNAVDKEGSSVLFYAVSGNRSREFIELLIQLGVDWRKTNKNQGTALHLAAFCGNLTSARLFLELGLEVNDRDVMGKTALDYARDAGADDEMIKLLMDNGAT